LPWTPCYYIGIAQDNAAQLDETILAIRFLLAFAATFSLTLFAFADSMVLGCAVAPVKDYE
jgi:hypothetical protein